MFEKLASLRVNLLIVFVGAPLIILMIKAVSLLLPPKYYFSFSKLVAGSSEPFIVDPPGITAKKLCEVLARDGIPRSTFRGQIRTCDRDYERPISPREMDEIYGIALGSDARIRQAYRDEAARGPIQPMSDDQIRELAANTDSVGDVVEAITDHYLNQIIRIPETYNSEKIAELFIGPVPDDAPAQSDDDKKKTIPASVVARIVEAHASLRGDLVNNNFAEKMLPIKKSTIDEMTRGADSVRDVAGRISQYYSGQIGDDIRATITNNFAKFDLVANRKAVFEEINKFSWTHYLLSVLVRLTPVFLFGIACGLALGRGEVLSASMAGGMAAFLLSWPLMLMWDRLVQSAWTDKKWLFFCFYAVYIFSFFLTARCAAIIGARLRENLPSVREKIASGGVTWRDVAINTAGAMAINAVVYAWNIYLPLTSANAQ